VHTICWGLGVGYGRAVSVVWWLEVPVVGGVIGWLVGLPVGWLAGWLVWGGGMEGVGTGLVGLSGLLGAGGWVDVRTWNLKGGLGGRGGGGLCTFGR